MVGPRRWLETRLADRVNEYCTSMLPQQKKQAEALGQKLQDQEDLKELQDRYADTLSVLWRLAHSQWEPHACIHQGMLMSEASGHS